MGIAAEKVKINMRILGVQFLSNTGNQLHGMGFAAANINITVQFFLRSMKSTFCFFH